MYLIQIYRNTPAYNEQGLCRLGLEFFSNGPENIYLHDTK